jgi:hypothetical protein
MQLVRTLMLVVAAGAFAPAAALAQDAPGPGQGEPAPGPGATEEKKPAEPAKKERKVDPKAQEVYDRYRKLAALPSSFGVKELTSRGEFAPMQLGGETIVIRPTWKAEGGLTFKFELPESIVAQIPPEMLPSVEQQITGQFRQFVDPFFDDPTARIADYNLEAGEEGGKTVVTLTPFAPKATNDKVKVTIGADGLPESYLIAPKGNESNPMTGGQDILVNVKHAKRGEKFVVSDFDITLPFGVVELKADYAEGPAGLPLVKSIRIATPMSPEPDTMYFYDYVVDGKAVEGTAKPKAEEKKPEEKKPETPAPAPEAPKDAGPGK